MRFQYVIKDKESIWEKVVVHNEVVTLYYRRKGESSEDPQTLRDGAIFKVIPPKYEGLLIYSDSELHKSLSLHVAYTMHEMIKLGAASQQDTEGAHPDAVEQMLFHYHIYFKGQQITETILFQVINDFEAVNQDIGNSYIAGTDKEDLKKKFGEHLQRIKTQIKETPKIISDKEDEQDIKSLADKFSSLSSTQSSSFSKQLPASQEPAKPFVPQYRKAAQPDIVVSHVKLYLKLKLGAKFMKEYGTTLDLELKDKENVMEATLSLPNIKADWFANKELPSYKLTAIQTEDGRPGKKLVVNIPVTELTPGGISKLIQAKANAKAERVKDRDVKP